MAQVALSAEAAKCASTTPWLPRLLWLQLNGILRQIREHLTVWWHKATSLLVGSVMSVATSGVLYLIIGSAKKELAARCALIRQGPRNIPATSLCRVPGPSRESAPGRVGSSAQQTYIACMAVIH